MRKRELFLGLVLLGSFIPTYAPVHAEDMSEDASENDKENEMMRAILEKLRPQIEAEVQARVKEEVAKIEASRAQAGQASANAPTTAASKEQMSQLERRVDALSEAAKKSVPSEFNPAIGLVGETIFSFDSQNNSQTGNDRNGGVDVNQRSVELNLSASVDPFARGYAVINASADPITGEAAAGVEEAAIITTSLPYNLTAEGGRFFGEFGRLAFVHDHELPFVNRPLALDKYIGGESKTDGFQLNWLLPIEHYVSWSVGIGDQFGDTPNSPGGYRAFSELNYWTHLSTYFTPTPSWSLETGASGLWNPRTVDRGGVVVRSDSSTLTEKQRQLYGVEATLRYEPLQNNQFRGFVWGTELLYSRDRFLVDPDGSLNPDAFTGADGDEFRSHVGSLGLYSYMAAKLNRQWTAGFLFDELQDAQNRHNETFAYSPFVTWSLSHFQTLRLQYTHTDRSKESELKDEDAVYLQWVWIIGSHSHGFSQR